MDGQDDKQQPIPATEFGSEAPGSDKVQKTQATGKGSSDALSQAATESAEVAKGKKVQPVFKAGVPQMDNSQAPAPSPEPIVQPHEAPKPAATTRPSSIYDLINQARQAPTPETAPMQSDAYSIGQSNDQVSRTQDTQGPSGNWNSAKFINPLPLLNAADEAHNKNDLDSAFKTLAKAQDAVDLLTPDNLRVIVNDLKRLKIDLAQETDSTKSDQIKRRIVEGTQILDRLWECPLRLAFAMFSHASANDQARTEAYRLLRDAVRMLPKLKDDPDVKKTIEYTSSLYGNMAPAVKQAMEQAVATGAQLGQQNPLPRSEFQDDPQLVERLAEQGRQARLDSPDPYVHAREAAVLMKSKGVLSQEARDEHDKSIELAKKIENAKKESFNSVLGEIGQIKKDIYGKQAELAKLQDQINVLKKESKSITTEVVAINAARSEEDKKSHSANMLDAGWSLFNRQLKEWNGDAAKEENVYQGKMAELTKRGNELRKLEAQRKALEGEIKSSEGSLKDKQTKLAEIGKPIADKHVSYAKALLTDADVRVDNAIKAKAEGKDEECKNNLAQQMTDIVNASLQLNRAEKITPELANNEELKELKKKHNFVTTSIGENIKDITPELKQDLDDRFLTLVNVYNKQRTDELPTAIAAEIKQIQDLQKELQAAIAAGANVKAIENLQKELQAAIAAGTNVKAIQGLQTELNGLKSYYPELKDDPKLRAALSLIGRGAPITDEALAETATIQSKALKLGENLQTGVGAMQAFEESMSKRQYKDAEEVLKIGMENLKPIAKEQHDQLQAVTQAFNNCRDLDEMVGLRQQKEALEQGIAGTEAKILDSIGSLYLTPEQYNVKQKDGTVKQEIGPGLKPEQALQALKQAKEAFPGIEKNPLYDEQLKTAQGLLKGVKEMEIKARDDADKAKEAGIDLATTLTSWGAAAGAGALATGGLIAAGVMVAGAPVTVPAALAIVGITTVVGAVTGGLTKWGLSNALDAKDKDFGRNMSEGALNGATSGLGGGGLKVGGMVLAQGFRGAGIAYEGIKYADVYAKVSKVAPLNQSVATILQGAKGNVAKEVQLGEQILEGHLKAGKITEQTYNTAKSWLSGQGMVKGVKVNTAEILQASGITMSEEAATAAGLKMAAAAGANGTGAINAGYQALKVGMPEANLPTYAWYNLIGKGANMGRGLAHNVGNFGQQIAYATPYNLTRTAFASVPLATATGIYNANKYGSKVAAGEINEATGEKWNYGDGLMAAYSNTAIDTTIGLASMGALRNLGLAADVKTGGAVSATKGGAWLVNKFTGGSLGKVGDKLAGTAPVAAMRNLAQGLGHDNAGAVAPFLRNAIPLGISTIRPVMANNSELESDNQYLANRKGDLTNFEIEQAPEESAAKTEIAQEAPKPQDNVSPRTTQQSEVQTAEDGQQSEPPTADASQPSPGPSQATETSGPPQPLADT